MLNTDGAWSKYRKIRNKCIKKVRLAKVNYEARVWYTLKANTNNIKTWWKLSKQALNIDRTTEPVPLVNYNNTSVESDQEKANVFNEYFIAQTVLNDNNATLPELLDPPYEQLHAINIIPFEICDILRSLNISKASGPDLISPCLLRKGANQLCIPIFSTD